MLPLAGVLETNDHVKELVLAGAGIVTANKPGPGNGDSNARILRWILKNNTSLTTLNLSNTGLSEDGLREICDGLKENKSITEVDISRNYFTEAGMHMLKEVLEVNPNLKVLDISRNALPFQAISLLETSKLEHKAVHHGGCCELRVSGNFVFEEILNSVTHGIGFLMAIVQTVLLMSEASMPGKTSYHFYSCLLFSVSLMCLFLASTLYHSFFMMPTMSSILQRADHCGIYMLIAGTYTPFLLLGMHHVWEARIMCMILWLMFLCGTVFSMAADLNNPSTGNVELCFYLGMGLSALTIWPQVAASLEPVALQLLILGGAFYVGGVVFFKMGEKLPIFHVVWHLCVLAASLCHWICVYRFIVGVDLNFESLGINSEHISSMSCVDGNCYIPGA